MREQDSNLRLTVDETVELPTALPREKYTREGTRTLKNITFSVPKTDASTNCATLVQTVW